MPITATEVRMMWINRVDPLFAKYLKDTGQRPMPTDPVFCTVPFPWGDPTDPRHEPMLTMMERLSARGTR